MRIHYPLSMVKLHQLLLDHLRRPEIVLQYRPMRAQQGLSNWGEANPFDGITIDVDANQQTGCVDHISTVVHELLHVVFLQMFLGWLTEDMEEIGILAYDAALTAYIRKSPKRLQTWTEAINLKLQENTCLE